jgi:hypothetical protein
VIVIFRDYNTIEMEIRAIYIFEYVL